MSYDLVVHGGHVIDPANGIDERRDIAIADGLVSAVEPIVPLGDTREAIDATGLFVVPGLVDLHVHVYWGVADLSLRPGPNDLERGATTIVDAGSAGASTIGGFREYVIEPFAGRILAFLNISGMGLIDVRLGENHDLRFLDPERAAQAVKADPATIVGIKVRLIEGLAGPDAIEALERAIEAGDAAGVPVMAHIGESAATTDQIMSRLRPDDIVTHAFTDRRNRIFDDRGRVHAAVLEARRRGVRFDIGHGAGSFSFARGEAALADGFRPDTISSDLHVMNVDGPVHDLVTTLSKFLHLGLPLAEVIAMATTAPADAIGRRGDFGTLSPGAIADVAILRLDDGDITLRDSLGVEVTARRRIRAESTIRAGRRVANT